MVIPFKKRSMFPDVILWAALWGIFEATAGYLLHLLPIRVGWLVWYPVACFFMMNAYRRTGRASAILLAGGLCAAIKLTNLLLPGRVDTVINPAVSILFESLTLAGAAYVRNRMSRRIGAVGKAAVALAVNTGWRALYCLYLLFLVPDWMRQGSAVSGAAEFVEFFVTRNLITSAVLFLGYQFRGIVMQPVVMLERRLSGVFRRRAVRTGTAGLMLCVFVLLEYFL